MLVNFFQALKDGGVPVTPRELLDLLAAMNKQLVFGSIDDFYNLSRAVMVKDEKYYDRFDRAFGLSMPYCTSYQPENSGRKDYGEHTC